MRWFDGHLDLTYIAQHGRDLTLPVNDCGGTLQPASVTFPTLRAAHVRAAVSTLFVRRRHRGPPPQKSTDGPFCFDDFDQAHAAALRQIDLHRQWLHSGLIAPLQVVPMPSSAAPPSGADALIGCPAENAPLQVVLAIEGAACIRRLEDLPPFYDAGVRIVSLAWAEGSPWSGGDQSGGDITPDGRELIRELDTLHCVHDVSHLSEAAFWTLLSEARGPIVASHSNCRALLPGSPHPERHLSDKQIQALAAAGGLIGLNLFARFLIAADELAHRRATIADVLAHLRHIEQIAGRRDILALGSDMDSGFGRELLPVDLDGPEHLHRLAEALSLVGWTDSQIENFTWGNWDRLLRERIAPPSPNE